MNKPSWLTGILALLVFLVSFPSVWAIDTEPAPPVIPVRGPESTRPLDLVACVKLALEANDALQAERLRMDELEGQMDQALSTGLPTLDLVGNWSRRRDPAMSLDDTFGGDSGSFGPPTGSPDWFNQWLMGFGSIVPEVSAIPAQTFLTAGLNMNWQINPMKIKGAVGAARLGIDRQKWNETHLEITTADQTLAAFWGIIRAAENVESVRAQLVNQTELLEIMRLRHKLGMVSRLDTLQAAVSRANTLPQLDVAQAQLRNQGALLNSIMGRDPDTPLSVIHGSMVELDPLVDQTAIDLALQRPDLKAMDTMTDILRRNRAAQKSENMPFITLTGSYGYMGKEFDSIFKDGHENWSAGVALTVPVFDGLMNRGLVSETEAQIRRTEAEIQGTRRQVQVEVLEVLANLRMARGLLEAMTLNLESAQEVLEESLLMLELGKTSYLDVLVAEANRAEARNNLIDARYQVLTLTSSLKRAMGISPLVPLASIDGLVAEVH